VETLTAQPALFASLLLDALSHRNTALRERVSFHVRALLNAPDSLDPSSFERLEVVDALCLAPDPVSTSQWRLLHHLAQPLLEPWLESNSPVPASDKIGMNLWLDKIHRLSPMHPGKPT
jgi:hypothetical protein